MSGADFEAALEESKIRRNNQELREQNRQLAEALNQARATLDLAYAVDAAKLVPPKWTAKKTKGRHQATPVFLLTDTHFDAIINPAEIMGLNAYNRVIAMQRLERAFTGAVKFSKDYFSGHDYDGFILLLGGDIFNGEIHSELTQTNEDTIIGSVIYWLEPMIAGIRLLKEEFGKVHVAGVVGNHSRKTLKPRSKLRVKDNYDWMFYTLLASRFAGDKSVTFQIPESADCLVDVYDRRILLTHGDQARGGNGTAGIHGPISLMEARKARKHFFAEFYTEENLRYNLMVMGHFHQRAFDGRKVVGGSLMGLDEYAQLGNFFFEPPSQELLFFAPGHGMILNCPIYVADRKAEGW